MLDICIRDAWQGGYSRIEIPTRVILSVRGIFRAARLSRFFLRGMADAARTVPIDTILRKELRVLARFSVKMRLRIAPSTRLRCSCHFCSGSCQRFAFVPIVIGACNTPNLRPGPSTRGRHWLGTRADPSDRQFGHEPLRVGRHHPLKGPQGN